MTYTVEQINTLTLDDSYEEKLVLDIIRSRLYSIYLSNYSGEEAPLVIDAMSFTEIELNAELSTFKSEMVAYITELNRVNDLVNRFNSNIHNREAANLLYGVANPDRWFVDSVKDNADHVEAEEFISAIETKSAELTLKYDKQELREAKIKQGELYSTVSKRVLNLIAGYNLSSELTIEQIDQMELTFSDIKNALNNSRPDKAFALISAAVPDGTLVTQDLKDDIIEELSVLQA